MQILITGGLGFIFSHVAEHLQGIGHNVTVVDNLSDGSDKSHIDRWENKIDVKIADVCDLPDMVDDLKTPDIIIHAAAESNVDKSIETQNDFVRSNVQGTLAALQFAEKIKIKHQTRPLFLLVNTDEVYGSVQEPATDYSILNPRNVYSATKAAASHLAWSFYYTFGLNLEEIRMCNVIGPRQAKTKILPKLIHCAYSGQQFPIYDSPNYSREYIDVRDVCTVVANIIHKRQNRQHEIIHVTTNQSVSILEMINKVEIATGCKINVFNSSRLGHDHHYRMAPNEIMSTIQPHTVDETIEWMLIYGKHPQ